MFIKTVCPAAIGRKESFTEIVDKALDAGFFGYWFDSARDFTLPCEEMLKLIRLKHIVPMGMELPVEFRQGEDSFLKDLENLEKIADYAKSIGIRRCATWIVPYHDSLCYSKNFKLHVDRLRKILDVLDRYGISLGLKFQAPVSLRMWHKYWFVHSFDGLFSLISAIDCRNCGVIMNSWHWQFSGMKKFDFNQFKNGEQIIAVHINDAPKGLQEEDYQDLSRELPCTTGILKIRDFLAGIDEIGFNGPLIVEPFYDRLNMMSLDEVLKLVSASMDKALKR